MAYAKRSLKKKTTKKRSTMKRKAPKAKVTSRGRAQTSAPHRQTGYARALLDPKDGPLVGVPQFVPIDTHRVRVRAIGVVNSTSGSARIFFNPARMVASDASPIKHWSTGGTIKWTGAIGDSPADGSSGTIGCNAPYTASDFQATSVINPTAIDNGDGVKARVVGAMIRVCNVSSVQTRGGVFTALHEPHHKTLEGFDLAALSKDSKSIIRPAGDGGFVSLIYRPVKPEEVEEWQINAFVVPGQQSLSDGSALDGTAADAYPGYMAIDFQGEPNSTLHVEAYAIVEYAGETVTTLSRPVGSGGGKAGKPGDVPPATKDAALREQQQGWEPGTPGKGAPVKKPSLDTRLRTYRRNKTRAKDSLSAREEILSNRIERLEQSNKAARQERLQLARADRSARNATARNKAAIERMEFSMGAQPYNFESP